MRRLVAGLLLVVLLPIPAIAQERGAPLVEDLGGPLGYGPYHSDVNPVDIRPAFPELLRLYGQVLWTFHVNWYGSITGMRPDYDYADDPFPRPADPMPGRQRIYIAPFAHSGRTSDYDPLGEVSPVMVHLRPAVEGVSGRLVATWLDIPDRRLDSAGVLFNTWQAVITDAGGPDDYDVEFRYHRCEWVHARNRDDLPAVVGFDAGLGVDGPGWTWPGSLSPDVLLLCALSNVGERGVWRYPVRGSIPGGCGIDAEPPPGPGRCADGNHLPGDGCSPDCHVEPDADGDARYEAPYPGALDPRGVYDDCADPDDILCNDDIDGDGVSSLDDNCVDVANPDQHDYEGDGIGDACDRDADNDGLDSPVDPESPLSFLDTCPFLRSDGTRAVDPALPDWVQPFDTDRDGLADPCDPDDDGDGIADCGEDGICATRANGYNDDLDNDTDEATECLDARGALCTAMRDAFDNDADGWVDEHDEDGLPRVEWPGPDAGEDNCRLIPNAGQGDIDGDGIGDACDPDTDGDGIEDCAGGICGPDADFRDNDADGRIDERGECALGCDPLRDLADQDLDGYVDEAFEGPVDGWPPARRDVCPGVADPEQRDRDGDGVGDLCADDDGDGVIGRDDNCVDVANRDQLDLDGDGLGDACDVDDDGDGIADAVDRCPRVADPMQADADGDGIGDACDPDDDGDGVPDVADRCPRLYDPEQADLDGDGMGDGCDADDDGDGTPDDRDRCPRLADDQRDIDGDGLGDACDPDDDGDGIDDAADLCPAVADDQADLDGDGIGDACDETDDRPFAARTPAERCQILLDRRAPTAERIGVCPAPRRAVGCQSTPGTTGSDAWLLALCLLGLATSARSAILRALTGPVERPRWPRNPAERAPGSARR